MGLFLFKLPRWDDFRTLEWVESYEEPNFVGVKIKQLLQVTCP